MINPWYRRIFLLSQRTWQPKVHLTTYLTLVIKQLRLPLRHRFIPYWLLLYAFLGGASFQGFLVLLATINFYRHEPTIARLDRSFIKITKSIFYQR